MSDIIKEYVGIILELLCFSLLFFIVIFIGTQARDLQDVAVQREELRRDLMETRELYSYDGKILTGDDIVIAVRKYTKLYDMHIQLGGVGSAVWYNGDEGLSRDSDDSLWSTDSLYQSLGRNISERYKAHIDKDPYGTILGIVFTRIN